MEHARKYRAVSHPGGGEGRRSAAGEEGLRRSKIPMVIDVPPVVLVPGIGGSIMVDPKSQLRVWIRLYEAEYYFKRFMWGVWNSSTRTLDPLKGQPRVEPLLTGHGLDAIRNLDPSVHWPIYDYVSYFDSIITVLEYNGWVPGLNLFGVPWDWRQSMCWAPTLERLKETLLKAQRLNPGRKVKLVSHSMGALVIKCFVATYPEVAQQTIGSWVSIAAPWQGASAKIYTELLQGYNLGNIVLDPACAKGVSMVSPSVYELLPSGTYDWIDPPLINMRMNGVPLSFKPSGPQRYDIPMRNANVNYTVVLPDSGTVLPEGFNEEVWALSEESRDRIRSVELPLGVKFYNVYGVNQTTPLMMDYGNVGNWSELMTKEVRFFTGDGDGTVSTESAMSHGLEAAGELPVDSTHMGLLMEKTVLQFVTDFLYERL